MKYLVMECHAGYAVLMDEESRFVRAANLHYTVGQTVTDPVLMRETQGRAITQSKVLRIAAVAACLVLVSVTGIGLYLRSRRTQSVVVMVEQTRYEMSLNKSGEVTVVKSFVTEDGEEEETETAVPLEGGAAMSPADAFRTVLQETVKEADTGEDPVPVYLSAENDVLYEECKAELEIEAAKLKLNTDVKALVPTAPKAHEKEKPAKTEEPAKRTEADPKQPVHPAQPTEPKQPVQPAEPATPDQPAEPQQPKQPKQPTVSDEPQQPVQPEEPAQTKRPEKPVSPKRPEKPVQPKQPEEPVQPDAEISVPEQPKDNNLPAPVLPHLRGTEPQGNAETEPVPPVQEAPAEPPSPPAPPEAITEPA